MTKIHLQEILLRNRDLENLDYIKKIMSMDQLSVEDINLLFNAASTNTRLKNLVKTLDDSNLTLAHRRVLYSDMFRLLDKL